MILPAVMAGACPFRFREGTEGEPARIERRASADLRDRSPCASAPSGAHERRPRPKVKSIVQERSMNPRKSYWETPMLTYWRRLNAELVRMKAKPVLFCEAFEAYRVCRDPERAAVAVAQSQGVDVSAFVLTSAA